MLEIIANAKVNLFLEITGKLPNGYHTVDTVMQSVALSDIIRIELLSKNEGIKLLCSDNDIPVDERNIAYKTAQAFLNAINADCGAMINIVKNIPAQAGMGGGSADGAAVLVALNRLCGDPMSVVDLKKIAAQYGADIPFCVDGGTQRLSGIGTDIVDKFDSPDLNIVIVKPPVGISTPAAYRFLDELHNDFIDHKPLDPAPFVQNLLYTDRTNKKLQMYNRFEETLGTLCVESFELISFLRSNGCEAILSGSGSAVFAIAESAKNAQRIADSLSSQFADSYVCVSKTAKCGSFL